MKFLVPFLSLLLTLPALAGPSITGGGKGVVCRSADNKVQSVELLDLWEARTIYGRTIPESSDPVELQLQRAASRLKFAMEQMPTLEAKPGPDALAQEVLLRAKPLLTPNSPLVKRLRGMVLSPVDDSFENARPSDCTVEQLVQYTQGGFNITIFVNQDLVDKMSPTNQAALILHEALYRRLRDMLETNSIRARRTVGYVFAGGVFPDLAEMLKQPHVACYHEGMDSQHAYVYFTPAADGGLSGYRVFDGTYKIGYFEAPALASRIDATNWQDLFSDRACAGSNANGPVDNLLIEGAGPADFDNAGMLGMSCKNGKLGVFFDPMRGDIVGGPNDPKLICEVIR